MKIKTARVHAITFGVCLSLGLGTAAQAEVPNVFQPGTAISSSAMNSNFDDLDAKVAGLTTRVEGLEDGPGAAAIVSVDCTGDMGALADAIMDAPPHSHIQFSGTCSPIEIRQDGLILEGMTSAQVVGDGVSDAIVIVDAARKISLRNFSVDGSNGAEDGIRITSTALVEMDEVTVTNAADGNLAVFLNSVVRLNGGNSIGDSDDETGLIVGANATVLIEGENTLSAGFGAIDCEFSGTVIQEGEGLDERVTIVGDVNAVENCFVFLSNGSVSGRIRGQQNTSITIEPEGDDSSFSVGGSITLSQGSSLLVDASDVADAITLSGARMFLLNSTGILRDTNLQSTDVQLHAASRLEIDSDVTTAAGTNSASACSTKWITWTASCLFFQMHSFSSLHSSQATGALTANEVECFGSNSAFHSIEGSGVFTDLCQ